MNIDELEYWMKREAAGIPEWREPECYDLNNANDRQVVYDRIANHGAKVHGRVAEIAEDLFEMRHPDQKDDVAARKRFMDPMVSKGIRYGKWFYFPWSNSFVQYPGRDEHRQLLTFRNRELITAQELRKISQATTAHIGLSVGSHIVTQVTHMGLGSKVILADLDVVSVPNLNRIHAGMPEVGMRKTDLTGILLSELNPYVEQVHIPVGISPKTIGIIARHHPDLIFEEVDHMPTKLLLRRLAQREKSALLMVADTGDRSMIDVERYDLGGVKPFLGRLTNEELALIEKENPTPQQTVELIINLIGEGNISRRFARSLNQIGATLGGIAQLGTTASAGAAYAAVAGREILLGRGPVTGRYKMSPQEVLGLYEF